MVRLKVIVIWCLVYHLCDGYQRTEDDERFLIGKSCVIELDASTCQQYANSCGPAVGALILRQITSSDCPSVTRASEDVLIWNMRTQNVHGVTEEEGGTLATDMALSLNRFISLSNSNIRYEVQRLRPSIYSGDLGTENYNTNYLLLCRIIYNSLVSEAPCALLTFFRHDDGSIYGHFVLVNGITVTDDDVALNYWDPAINEHREMYSWELNDLLRFGGELIYNYPYPDFNNCLDLIKYPRLHFGRLQRRQVDNEIESCTSLKFYKGKMGLETSHGNWKYRYQSSFPYEIQGRHFFYAQSVKDGKNWFIQELLPNGKMGQQTNAGSWNEKYTVALPYFDANGRHYFYAQSNINGKNWFIQELLPDGKMGNKRMLDSGLMNMKLHFHSQWAGEHFSGLKRHTIMIGSFMTDGRMGEKTDHGDFNVQYKVAFSYSVDGKHYCFFQNHYPDQWAIFELKPGGKIGEKTDEGTSKKAYSICAPFHINHSPFFYCQSNLDGRDSFIQKLLPGGKMGEITDRGSWAYKYEALAAVVPYFVYI